MIDNHRNSKAREQSIDPSLFQILKGKRSTVILAVLTLLVLALSFPGSLREAIERGAFYVFTHAFLEDLPKRLAGPGRFRFVLQPSIAIILGILGGLRDARAGRPAFFYAFVFHRELRRELVSSVFRNLVNLLLMGILMDSAFQWVILGASYPGAALVVGPVLTVLPYTLARSFSNRLAR